MKTEYIVGVQVQPDVAGVHEVRSLENPNLPLNDAAIWGAYGLTNQTVSGVSMNPDRALTYSPVWQAVNLISGDVAKLPLNVYRRLPDGLGREVDRSHPAHRFINRRFNRELHAKAGWRRLMVHALIWNHGYAHIMDDGLYPLLPDRTCKDMVTDGPLAGQEMYFSEIGGRIEAFFPHEIFHLHGITIDGKSDCQLVQKARESWARGLSALNMASRYFANGGRTGGILEIPTTFSKKGRDNLEEGFRKTYERQDAAFKTVILREGARFHAAQFTAEETQLIPARQEDVRDTARWYNLPPHKLGEGTSTSSYNSLEQENQAYKDGTLDHWLVAIATECEMKLLTEDEHLDDTHYVEHNTAALLRTDLASRFDVYQKAIDSGILSPDEARSKENMNPRPDGLGGQYRHPMNFAIDGEGEPDPPDEDDRSELIEATLGVVRKRLGEAVERFASICVKRAKKGKAPFWQWRESQFATELRRELAKFEPEWNAFMVAARSSLEFDALASSVYDGFRVELERAQTDDDPASVLPAVIQDIAERQQRGASNQLTKLIQGEN